MKPTLLSLLLLCSTASAADFDRISAIVDATTPASGDRKSVV